MFTTETQLAIGVAANSIKTKYVVSKPRKNFIPKQIYIQHHVVAAIPRIACDLGFNSRIVFSHCIAFL